MRTFGYNKISICIEQMKQPQRGYWQTKLSNFDLVFQNILYLNALKVN